jgi:hypothetical protein
MRQANIKMTLIRPIETETAVPDALELSEGLYLRMASALEVLAKQVEAGKLPDIPNLKKTATSLREGEAHFLKERNRVIEQRRTDAGVAGDFAIDFDAVRAEIGGRLNRLRKSRGSGEVSQ